MHHVRALPLAIVLLAVGCSTAPSPTPTGGGAALAGDVATGLPTHWGGDVTVTGAWRGAASIDGPAGDVTARSANVTATANGPLGWIGSLGYLFVSHERATYDFDGPDPFDDLQRTSVIGVLFQGVHEDGWGVVLAGGLDFAAERAEDLDRGRGWVTGFGVVRAPFDGLVIVVGAVVVEPPKGEPSLIPGAQMLWTIDDEWELRVVGPGAELIWSFADDWRASLVASYGGTRHRLDDDAGSGFFEDSRLDLALELGWTPTPSLDIAARFGVELVREITFRGRDGHRLAGGERDVDPTPTFSLSASLTF